MKFKIQCDWCGKEFEKYESRISKHNFCCRDCLASFSSKSKNPNGYNKLKDYSNMSRHLSELNVEMNPTRMTASTRKKIREAHLGRGSNKAYKKLYGRHEHRVIAEKIIGRLLESDEVVHHIDGDFQNNNEDNLRIFSSQAEHARFHKELDAVLKMINS